MAFRATIWFYYIYLAGEMGVMYLRTTFMNVMLLTLLSDGLEGFFHSNAQVGTYFNPHSQYKDISHRAIELIECNESRTAISIRTNSINKLRKNAIFPVHNTRIIVIGQYI